MEHRSGLEPDKSGFAILRFDRFGIQCSYNNKLWLGRKDSNLRTLGSEPSAVAAVLLPKVLVIPTILFRSDHNNELWRARGESNQGHPLCRSGTLPV
jgi:hypothetical protein